MHFDLTKNSWYYSYNSSLKSVSRAYIIEKVLLLFKHIVEDDIIVDSIGFYIHKQCMIIKKGLRPYIHLLNSANPSSNMYFMSSAISSVKDDIKCPVHIFKPLTVVGVFTRVSIQEAKNCLSALLSRDFGRFHNAPPRYDSISLLNISISLSFPNKLSATITSLT